MKFKFLFLIIVASFLFSGCTSSNYSSSYDDYDSYEPDYEEPITSDNWECTDDCSGHEAGYQWAEDNDITEPDDCSGNSDSFIEGYEAYANENYPDEDEEYYGDYEDNYYY